MSVINPIINTGQWSGVSFVFADGSAQSVPGDVETVIVAVPKVGASMLSGTNLGPTSGYRLIVARATTIGSSAFKSCTGITSATLHEPLTTIGSSAFYDCSSLASVTIPSSVTSLGDSAFSYCSSLASVTIPSSVTTISVNAFRWCESLASVTIPSSVTTIGVNAFLGCESLASVTIPSSVTTISDSAFQSCTALASITVQAATPPSLSTSSLPGTSVVTSIKVPAASVDAYKAASGWSAYAAVITAI